MNREHAVDRRQFLKGAAAAGAAASVPVGLAATTTKQSEPAETESAETGTVRRAIFSDLAEARSPDLYVAALRRAGAFSDIRRDPRVLAQARCLLER